ncbi:MAG TPA: POTRA domain-containing protein [Terriglobales bacterium]|nr:POTRA domain-containing protein [Terriglobales bacterium]
MLASGYSGWRYRCAALFDLILCATFFCAQTGPTATPAQTPHTSQQTKEVLPSYEGQNVSSVELAGQPDLDTESLLPLAAQKPNQPFSQAKVDETIAALKQTRRFHDVQIQIRPEPAGVRVLFVLEPAVYFGVYSFPGAEQTFAYARLLQVAAYPPRGPYTSVDVATAQEALERFLHREGYFQSQVKTRVVSDKVHGLANVYFDTVLGRKAKFGTVTLTGATPQGTALLHSRVQSFRARLRNAAIRTGKTYSLKTLQNATNYLQNSLMSKDRLDAKVKLISANYDAGTNRANITFNVQSGPFIHVQVEGAHVWSWTKKKLLPVYQEVGVDPEIIQEGRKNLVSHFQSKGYFDAKVNVTTQARPDGETILYQITKGPRHKVKDVDIAGNQSLKEDELRSHVPVKKAHILSHGSYSENLVHTSVKNLQRVYQANGFSDVKVTPEVDNEAGNIGVTFRVVEGERDIVEAMHIEGIDTQSLSVLAPKGLNLATGKPYSQTFVQEDRNTLMSNYLKLGYLNASFRQTAKPLDKDKHRLEVTYLIEEGPQVRTASVVTLGRGETQQAVINKAAPISTEAPLREDDMLTNETQLYNLGVFDWAEIDPRRRITTQSQEDVLVKVHEAKKNDLVYGFGFDVINRGGNIPSGTVAVPGLPVVGLNKNFKTSQKTFYGPRALIQYTRKDLWGKAQTISFNALGSRLDQRGQIAYTDPYFRGSNWASSFNIGGEHDAQNPIFTSVIGQAGWQLQRALNQDKTRNLFLRYNYSQTGLTELLIPDLVPPSDRHVRLSTLSAVYVRDTRDFQLDAHKGIYQSFETHFNPSFLGSNFNFGKFLAQTAYYKSITKQKIVWANSVRFGFAEAFSGHVPLSETFFTGGPNTLRGFALNGAGPQHVIPACGNPSDPSTCSKITVPVGGNQLFLVNSEFRIPVPLKEGLGIVPFYDGGNVFRTIGFHGQYTNSAGLGFRYATPVGPIRVDFGYNFNAPLGVKSWQYFITIGQAF